MRSEVLETPHGRCVLVGFDDEEAVTRAITALPAHEQALAWAKLTPHTRRDFVAGRTALHLALDDFSYAIEAGHRGAPRMPDGLTGSVSHKAGTAIAIVAPAGTGWVGIDLEHAAPSRMDIARRILTAAEQAALPADPRAVTLRFAIKEAIYKAVDPIVERYVGFTEVELDVGAIYCTVSSKLPAAIEATWREHGGHWIATARAVRKDS